MEQSLDPGINLPGPGELDHNPADDFTPIIVAYINCVGQSKFPISKQLEIQSYVFTNKIDILHLQECKIYEDSFAQCGFLTSNYNIFSNNKPDDSYYGTASLIRSDLEVSNIHTDDDGRTLIFDAAGCMWGNLYLPSGSDGPSRAKREQYFSEFIPDLLVRRLAQGAVGGDLNSIISLPDSTRNPHSKLSPSCRNLVRAFSLSDCFRRLYPRAAQYSRHSRTVHHGEGASRIDRSYHWGELQVLEAVYNSISFSDHLSLLTHYRLPHRLDRHLAPLINPPFKISPIVVNDNSFRQKLKHSMQGWLQVKARGVGVLKWLEILVKPGIKQLAIDRSKEIKKQNMGRLNILKLRQCNINNRINKGENALLTELIEINLLISDWYKQESAAIIMMSRSKVGVIQEIFRGGKPTSSQRTSLMVFVNKPGKKAKSLLISDRQKLSLLNANFKLITGIEAARIRTTMSRTISPLQLEEIRESPVESL